MWHFQRIICIWICCVSCMFGTTQLSTLVRAVPYEYFDEHEQSFYDLDTEQIQAKYDTRLLSQQMLQTEQQQQQQHLENLKGSHKASGGGRAESKKPYISTATTKLKSNDGHTLDVGADLDDDEEHKDWLEETATKAASLTTTITETLDELHLPRAASCFTNGQTFTHGQKVPRLDNCEVCLCMDGEIFCWWEKCDKKPTKASITYDDYSTPFEESSTTRMQLNPKTTYKTTLKPMRKPKTNEDYKYDDDDSAEISELQREYEGLKGQLMRKDHEPEQRKTHHNKEMAKKKIYQQQQQGKQNKKINAENKNKSKQEETQQSHKQHKLNEQHHNVHNHNNNRKNNHDYGPSGSSSKILNFPENLPAVLYYDYKTEEHHQHQHQHREQHLKHQKQKLQQQLLSQQHKKELKHQQHKQQNHVNRHHEYGQDFGSYSNSAGEADGDASGNKAENGKKRNNRIGGSSTTFKYFSNGNENIYSEDLQTDSDILPEPPTKKPKLLTSITDTTVTTKTTGTPITQLQPLFTTIMETTAGAITKSTTTTKALTSTPSSAAIPLKDQIFSPWDFSITDRAETNNNDKNDNHNRNNKSSDGTIDTVDQDDAFHRWLTSTETNNKINFTLNDAMIHRDVGGLDVAADASSGLDASNNDYNLDERNYENIDWETDTEFAKVKTKTKATIKPLATKVATTTANINTFKMVEISGGEDGGTIHYDNIQKPEYEQHFSENNDYNNNSNNKTVSNGIINSNDKSNNKNILPFSSTSYQNYNRNNNNLEIPTSSNSRETVTSSTTSNEDNGVSSVVNIDIMLTASSAESHQQQKQPQQTKIETTNQHGQLQLHDFENEKQFAKMQLKSKPPPALIPNTNDADNKYPLYSIINDNTRNFYINVSNKNNNNYDNDNNIVGNGLNVKEPIQLKNVGVNLPPSNNIFNNNSASSQSLSSSGDSLGFSHVPAWVSQANATSPPAATPPSLRTTLSPERQCNVMGTLYKIGDILPQDTGNCLQCICIDGSTSDDTPRVTCSPHNCPPLVLPDLFDATGY